MEEEEKSLTELNRNLPDANKKEFLLAAMAAVEEKPSLVKKEMTASRSPSVAKGAAQSLLGSTPQRLIIPEQPKFTVRMPTTLTYVRVVQDGRSSYS